MIERAFNEALLHKGNKKDALREFAISQARHILQAAGVVDPAIKDHGVAVKPEESVEKPFYMIPEGEVVKFIQEIGGKSAEQLEAEVKSTGREVTIYASDSIHSPKFEVLDEVTPQELAKFPVRALRFRGNPTTRQLYEKIPQTRCRIDGEEYILELPRAEVGPHKAIADKDQALNDWYYVMHEPITGRHGDPGVFEVEHDSVGRFLYGRWASPDDRWAPDDQLVVALRKLESVKP